jgi:hypothetical protein
MGPEVNGESRVAGEPAGADGGTGHHPANGNGARNGSEAHRTLKPLWEGPVHFVLRSAEATLALPVKHDVNVVDVVLQRPAPN